MPIAKKFLLIKLTRIDIWSLNFEKAILQLQDKAGVGVRNGLRIDCVFVF